MSELYTKLFNSSLEYGQGYDQIVGGDPEEATKNYDFSFDLKGKYLDYHIYKIIYTLNSNQSIQTLKMLYKNRKDGTVHVLLDTIISHTGNENKVTEIEFEDLEEIVEVIVYVSKNGRLDAISLKTNYGKVKYIGNEKKDDVIYKDENLTNGKNIIFGFGVQAGKKYGVSSIYCYYMDKNKYGIILFSGFLQLRAKLKKNDEFKNQIKARKDSLNEKQNLIYRVCDLPDAAFFPFACFLMSH